MLNDADHVSDTPPWTSAGNGSSAPTPPLSSPKPGSGSAGGHRAGDAGGLRDPSNTRRTLRECRGSEGFSWVKSHVYRKTAGTVLDEAGYSPRQIADFLGHARPSVTLDRYVGRGSVAPTMADAMEDLL